MVRFAIGILVFFHLIAIQAQSTNAIISGDTSYYYTDKDFELLMAASEGDTNKLLAFLEIGADVNTSSFEGVTPLMFAAQNGYLRSVEILIDSGAKVNMKPNNRVDALLGACIAGHVVVADTLILNGARVNTKNLNGVTPLMYAAAFHYPVMMDMLLFYKAKVNQADNLGNSPLIYSTFYNNIDLVNVLIGRGANVNHADKEGFTSFMIAAQHGNIDILELLRKKGADINMINVNNLDALSLAILGKYDKVVAYLLSNGMDTNRLIQNKLSQYDLAELYGNKSSLKLMKQAGAKPMLKTWIDKLYMNPALSFNPGDVMMGVHMGIIESKSNVHLELGYKTRPWVRSVSFKIEENTYYQFWEKRSLLHLGIDKSFNIKELPYYENLGLFVGINLGYTYGSFRGSNKKPDDQGVLIPKAGLFYRYKSFNIKANYEYMKFKNSSVSPHRLGISLGLMINLVKNQIKLKKEPVF